MELLIVVALIVVVAGIALPMLLRAKQSGNQASAVGSLRAIVSAQFTYQGACDSGYFAPSLTALGRAPAGGVPFISPDLGVADLVTKSNYVVTLGSTGGGSPLSPASCNGQAAGTGTTGYWATATPTLNAGAYAYGTNGAGVIYKADQQTAVAMTDSTAPAGATVIDR